MLCIIKSLTSEIISNYHVFDNLTPFYPTMYFKDLPLGFNYTSKHI